MKELAGSLEEKFQPIVLTKKQVWKIICTPGNLKHRLILMTTYAEGLRASDVIALKPKHIESEKMLIKVEGGKGRKGCYNMLSVKLVAELRRYYRKYPPVAIANSRSTTLQKGMVFFKINNRIPK